jgi:hypothetical protein
MPKKVKLDALLAKAAPLAMVRNEFDDADPVSVPDALREQVMVRAQGESGRLLADSILAAAEARGESREALISGTSDNEDVAALLDGRGDPRSVGPAVLARLLARAGADARDLRELILQTVAQLVVVRPQSKQSFFLRPLGLGKSGDERSRVALSVGAEFADKVVEEWEGLSGREP